MLTSAHLASAERKAEGAIATFERARERLVEAKKHLISLQLSGST
jgi:hypothetical protein